MFGAWPKTCPVFAIHNKITKNLPTYQSSWVFTEFLQEQLNSSVGPNWIEFILVIRMFQTNQVNDLEIMKQQKSLFDYHVRCQAEKEFDDWFETEKSKHEMLSSQGDCPVKEMESEINSDSEEIEDARLERWEFTRCR